MKIRLLAVLLVIALALIAIYVEVQTPAPAAHPLARIPVDNRPTGIIRGKVIYTGAPPPLHSFPGNCCNHDQLNPDPSFVLAADKSLRDVVVYLQDAPANPPSGSPATVVVLDQKNCAYVPHVLALEAGQTLRVINSDPTMHNVHGLCQANPEFNAIESEAGDTTEFVLKIPEVFPIRCDVHAWMRAEIHVMSHPYFAVTRADGTFEIDHVPVGKYRLVASHERAGDIEQAVSVQAGAPATVNFKYVAASKK